MDPLRILDRLGEEVDSRLIDDEPRRDGNFPPTCAASSSSRSDRDSFGSRKCNGTAARRRRFVAGIVHWITAPWQIAMNATLIEATRLSAPRSP
jgi:hypothetical protein